MTIYSLLVTLIILVAGIGLFRRMESQYPDLL
jgi:ABC-type polysaccharide/polyol phosphate export permease